MPPKKVTITPGQSNIKAFFQKSTDAKPSTVVITDTPLLETQAAPVDPRVKAFMSSLTPNEQIAHKIAKEKLGTSYDITRTHGFVRWSAAT